MINIRTSAIQRVVDTASDGWMKPPEIVMISLFAILAGISILLWNL